MARIRSIKPEFPQSETIGKLSRDARLLFIQLWTVVDDDGRTRAASRMLASLLYPYDDDARDLIDGWLSELENTECIRTYEVEGSTYLEITNWLKHQKIDRPSKSRLPAFDEGSPKPREESRSLDADLGPSILDLGPRTEDHSRTVAKATRPKSSEAFEDFWKAYPNRQGANPRKPAFQVFDAAVKQGADPVAIIEGARRCAAADSDKIGTPYIPQAVKWLRDRRWEDYAAGPPGVATISEEEKQKLFAQLRGSNGPETENSNVRSLGARPRESEGSGREEPAADADDQTGFSRVGSLAPVLRRMP